MVEYKVKTKGALGVARAIFKKPTAVFRRKNTSPSPKRLVKMSVVALLVAAMIANLFTPLLVNATSLTWSSNADFAMNKAGKCGKTILNSITISETSYTDESCGGNVLDSNITLSKDNITSGVFSDNFKKISAYSTHSFALKSDGTVWSWGYNYNHQLGSNGYRVTNPIQVKNSTGTGYLENIVDISTSSAHTIALDKDGTVWSWGWMGEGRIGDNTNTGYARFLPTKVLDSTGTGYLGGIVKIYTLTHVHFP